MTTIVTKPWGYEYIAYQNQLVAVKVLHINPHERTSLHCHPNKSTGLVVVGGQAIINFIADQSILNAPSKKMIRRGLFHQTIAISNDGVIMLEIETPVDQDDLVRLNDCYGRKDKGYESSTFIKEREVLQIKSQRNSVSTYTIGSSTLICGFIENFDFREFNDKDIIMMLNGGLVKTINDRTHRVIQPGDVGYVGVVKKVIESMDGFSEDTEIMVIK